MTPESLAEAIAALLPRVIGRLGGDPGVAPASVTLERPRNPEHGDYATNAAMQCGKRAGLLPRDLAAALAEALAQLDGVPAMAIKVASAAPLSANSVIAVWRKS